MCNAQLTICREEFGRVATHPPFLYNNKSVGDFLVKKGGVCLYRKQVRDCLTDLSFSLPSKSAHAHTETSVVDGLLEQR